MCVYIVYIFFILNFICLIHMCVCVCVFVFPVGSDGKESLCSAGILGSITGSGRSPREGNDDCPLQYSCLENPMDRRAWWAAVHWVTKSQTQLSNLVRVYIYIYIITNLCHLNYSVSVGFSLG